MQVAGQDASGAAFAETTRSINVSGGGICFECRQPLPAGARIELALELPKPLRAHFGGMPVYRVRAVVCRVERPGDQHLWRVGARFLGAIEA
jgi:hypothetical protein